MGVGRFVPAPFYTRVAGPGYALYHLIVSLYVIGVITAAIVSRRDTWTDAFTWWNALLFAGYFSLSSLSLYWYYLLFYALRVFAFLPLFASARCIWTFVDTWIIYDTQPKSWYQLELEQNGRLFVVANEWVHVVQVVLFLVDFLIHKEDTVIAFRVYWHRFGARGRVLIVAWNLTANLLLAGLYRISHNPTNVYPHLFIPLWLELFIFLVIGSVLNAFAIYYIVASFPLYERYILDEQKREDAHSGNRSAYPPPTHPTYGGGPYVVVPGHRNSITRAAYRHFDSMYGDAPSS